MEHSTDLTESIEQTLLRSISESGLKPGDALPSEKKLSEQLGVGRPAIREGLSRLKAMGLVIGNRRGGTILCKPQLFSTLNRLLKFNLLSSDNIRSLLALRILIEQGSAQYVFQNATNADFRELRALATQTQGTTLTGEDDLLFHRRMFQICGNHLLEDFTNVLDAFFNCPNFEDNLGIVQHTNHEITHLELCDELEHGTMQSFQKKLNEHLSTYASLFEPLGTSKRPQNTASSE